MNDPHDRSLSEEELRNEVVHRSNRGESKRRISIQLGVSRWKVAEILRRHHKNREAPKTNDLFNPRSGRREPNEPLSPDASPQVASNQDANPQSLGRPVQKRTSKLDAFEPQLQQLMDRYPRITVIRLQEELQSAGFAQEGRRKVQLFSYILGYSRRQYIYFTPRQDFETTVR